MSIQSVTNAPAGSVSRPSSPARSGGASFRERLASTVAKDTAAPSQKEAASPEAASPGREAFVKEDLLARLTQARGEVLKLLQQSRELTREREAWERLLECLDTWLQSLQEGRGGVEESVRAYAAASADPDRPTPESKILDQLMECFAG